MEKKNRFSLKTSRSTMRYLGLGTQLLAVIGVAVFGGYKADKWLNTLPLFSCVLPLLVLGVFYYKLARQLNNRNKNEQV